MRFVVLGPPERWGVVRRAVGTWLVLALTLGTVVVPEAWAADYYVDTGGNDGNTGDSAAAPWKTLTYALGQVSSGDVVHLAAGTYDTGGNGETFPLALVDGVAIVGAGAGSSILSAPAAVFSNDDTPLGPTTRLTGVTLQHDAAAAEPLMEFAVGSATMAPQIDHDAFAGVAGTDDEAISYWDASSASGTFTPTIDNNTFTDLYTGTWMYSLSEGTANDFSPTITNNTFTGCDWPINYTMSDSAEGTVGGTVQGNTFIGTNDDDIYINFYPTDYGTGLLFNPTITQNDMQSGASTNVYAYVSGYSYSGNATFSPTITNNTMDATDYNVEMYGYYEYMDGDYTVAPTISGNTMTGASYAAVSLYLSTLSVSTSNQRNVISPTITNNTITANGGDGVVVDLSDWSYGQLEGTATISGNSISGASYGIEWEMSYMSDGDGMDWSIIISNNTITSPTSDGITFSMESMSFSGSGIFNLTVDGNTVTDAGSYGIDLYPAYSWYSDNQVVETVLVRGNTVTGSTYDGMYLYFSDQTSNTLDARVTDNVLQGNQSGLDITSYDLGSNGIRIECNIFSGNTQYGVDQGGDDPPADYGGGNLSSTGGNIFMDNGTFDFYNDQSETVSAQSNWWGTTDTATIEAHIYDYTDNTGVGEVDFANQLSAAPTVTMAASLTDSVVNDVVPAGPSIGDTLLYTAVVQPSGDCGDASVSFTAPVDPNTTVVPGSVTTTRGGVLSDDPPTVTLGLMDAGSSATITWEVIVDGGTSVETQGTVTAGKTGSTLTDDPNVPGTSDPTVTVLVLADAGTVQFVAATASVDESAGTITLEVSRTGGSAGPITVDYASADGTAVAPGDYGAVSGQLSWTDGDTADKQIVVPIVDDSDVEGNETFTVTLSDLAAAAFVGSPATVTVTILDDEQAAAIPTLGQWGLGLFAGLLLLLGAGMLRRRRFAATALVVLAAFAVAAPALAGSGKAPAKKVYVTTLSSLEVTSKTAALSLADGTRLAVPEGRVVVREGHVKRMKGEAKVEAKRLSGEERRAGRHERKEARGRRLGLAELQPGTPALVTVSYDRHDGSVKDVKILTFATLDEARAELARKEAGRKHPRE